MHLEHAQGEHPVPGLDPVHHQDQAGDTTPRKRPSVRFHGDAGGVTVAWTAIRLGRQPPRAPAPVGGADHSRWSLSCTALAIFSTRFGRSVVPKRRESGRVGGGMGAEVVGPSW